MDVLQDWAQAYPALAQLLWVIVLVLATVLVWSLFFCCWGSQSSTSPLERYLSGKIAALILPQLTWNQFLLIFFSSFRISSRYREYEEELLLFFCSENNMLVFHDWLILVGTAWKSGWVVCSLSCSLSCVTLIWRHLKGPLESSNQYSSSIPKLNVPFWCYAMASVAYFFFSKPRSEML